MTPICLDTSAYSNFSRGAREAVEVIRRAREVLVPVVVLGELRTGFLLGSRPDENEAHLQRFLSQPVVRVLEVDDAASRQYADIVVALRRDGSPLPTNDIWIAALAAREGAVVLTYDAHFERIARVASRILFRTP